MGAAIGAASSHDVLVAAASVIGAIIVAAGAVIAAVIGAKRTSSGENAYLASATAEVKVLVDGRLDAALTEIKGLRSELRTLGIASTTEES